MMKYLTATCMALFLLTCSCTHSITGVGSCEGTWLVTVQQWDDGTVRGGDGYGFYPYLWINGLYFLVLDDRLSGTSQLWYVTNWYATEEKYRLTIDGRVLANGAITGTISWAPETQEATLGEGILPFSGALNPVSGRGEGAFAIRGTRFTWTALYLDADDKIPPPEQ